MPLDLESRLALDEDQHAVVAFLAERAGEAIIDPADDATRWVILHPSIQRAERYVARLVWTVYPHRPPSVLFVTDVGGQLGVASAWPLIPGYRAPNDICMPFTSEGYGLHAEWATGPDAWQIAPNPYLRVVTQLQDDLDHRYQGRGA